MPQPHQRFRGCEVHPAGRETPRSLPCLQDHTWSPCLSCPWSGCPCGRKLGQTWKKEEKYWVEKSTHFKTIPSTKTSVSSILHTEYKHWNTLKPIILIFLLIKSSYSDIVLRCFSYTSAEAPVRFCWHSSCSYLAPLRDLCVVDVTRSAYSKGEGIAPAATRPLMWAMSAIR